jgi:hypothetical protein
MKSKINSYKMECDFCGEKKPFAELEQTPLRIDKNSHYQYLFANMCEECSKAKKKNTANKQGIKTFVGRSKSKNEQSVFDVEEGND